MFPNHFSETSSPNIIEPQDGAGIQVEIYFTAKYYQYPVINAIILVNNANVIDYPFKIWNAKISF